MCIYFSSGKWQATLYFILLLKTSIVDRFFANLQGELISLVFYLANWQMLIN